MFDDDGVSRRNLLFGFAASLASIAVVGRGAAQTTGAASSPPLSVDTHAHVFKRGLKLAPRVRYVPDYDAPAEKYLEQLDAHDVRFGVIIQPSFLGVDNSYLVECLNRSRDRLRGVAVVAPDTPRDELMRLNDAGVVGVRLNLIGMPLPDLSEPVWKAHLEDIARLGWQVEVQCRAVEHAILAPRLIASGVNVVVDHFGLPDPQLGPEDPGWRGMLALGATRKLWVKVSAPYRLGDDGLARASALYPYLKASVGLDRLIWGSDWPNTQFEKNQNFTVNRAMIDQMIPDPSERQRVLSGGRDLFRF